MQKKTLMVIYTEAKPSGIYTYRWAEKQKKKCDLTVVKIFVSSSVQKICPRNLWELPAERLVTRNTFEIPLIYTRHID
jgi:hypothetical protein